MTCIVGLVHEGIVYMGGDSAAIDTDTLDVVSRLDEKVFMNDEMMMGFTSSFRMGQLLRYALTVPDHPSRKDSMAYLVTDFVDAVRGLFHEKGYLTKENEQESGGSFLLGYRGELFVIEEDFQVARHKDGYAAIGCGMSYALGSLHSTHTCLDPFERIRMALDAASHFSAGVQPPYTILKLELEETTS